VSEIEIRLRSRLVKEALSAVLAEAGFLISSMQDQKNDGKIISIIDFAYLRSVETIHAYQARGVKIVVLAKDAESLTLSPDEIAVLSGVLTLDLSADAFVQSLRLISSGERVFPRDLALERAAPAPQGGNVPLSPREREVLIDLVEGHSNKKIARRLGTAEATVKVHLKNILRKIRVDNRTQAAIWALGNLSELQAPRAA
jgi:two-component system, NarL family, nitrate/nitrite response regulator NarL